MLARLASAMRSMVTRGKVAAAVVGPRTLLQVTGLQNETKTGVELLLPPGYFARPAPGADVVILQVLGDRGHVVALGGDTAGQAYTAAASGEFGISNGTQTIIIHSDHIELIGPGYVLMTTPELRVTGKITEGYGGSDQVGVGTHTHIVAGTAGHTAAPDAGT
jgi:phage gp45-like